MLHVAKSALNRNLHNCEFVNERLNSDNPEILLLGHFPPCYPDELLYSACSRYAQRIPPKSERVARNRLFGRLEAFQTLEFPTNIDFLCDQIPPSFLVHAADVVFQNTLFPFFAAFVRRAQAEAQRTAMLRKSREIFSASLRGPSVQQEWLRFCRYCAARDRRTFRETYWHRLHNIGIVKRCPEHDAPLENSPVRRIRTNSEFIAAEDVVPQHPPHPLLTTGSSDNTLLVWIAKQVRWLLDQRNVDFTRERLNQVYFDRLLGAGFLDTHRTRRLNITLLVREIRKQLPSIEIFAWDFQINAEDWLRRIVFHMKGNPIEHLLLMRFLGLSPLAGNNSCG